MKLYIYEWSGLNNLIAITPTPDSNVLPSPDHSCGWRARGEMKDSNFLRTRLALEQVHEQIERYGYCLLNQE